MKKQIVGLWVVVGLALALYLLHFGGRGRAIQPQEVVGIQLVDKRPELEKGDIYLFPTKAEITDLHDKLRRKMGVDVGMVLDVEYAKEATVAAIEVASDILINETLFKSTCPACKHENEFNENVIFILCNFIDMGRWTREYIVHACQNCGILYDTNVKGNKRMKEAGQQLELHCGYCSRTQPESKLHKFGVELNECLYVCKGDEKDICEKLQRRHAKEANRAQDEYVKCDWCGQSVQRCDIWLQDYTDIDRPIKHKCQECYEGMKEAK